MIINVWKLFYVLGISYDFEEFDRIINVEYRLCMLLFILCSIVYSVYYRRICKVVMYLKSCSCNNKYW